MLTGELNTLFLGSATRRATMNNSFEDQKRYVDEVTSSKNEDTGLDQVIDWAYGQASIGEGISSASTSTRQAEQTHKIDLLNFDAPIYPTHIHNSQHEVSATDRDSTEKSSFTSVPVPDDARSFRAYRNLSFFSNGGRLRDSSVADLCDYICSPDLDNRVPHWPETQARCEQLANDINNYYVRNGYANPNMQITYNLATERQTLDGRIERTPASISITHCGVDRGTYRVFNRYN
jgi:hypothetical protein